MDDLTGSLLHAFARYISKICFGNQTDSLNTRATLSDVTPIDKSDDEDVIEAERNSTVILEMYSVKFYSEFYDNC